MKALGYIRVSRVGDRGDNLKSPEYQRATIERLAAQHNLDVIDVYEEVNKSGGDNTRPLWNKALDRIESGEAKALVCWNLSRFSRSLPDAVKALDRIHAAGGELYTEEGRDKLTRNILFSIAEAERDRSKAGFYTAQAAAIGRGVYIAAKSPVGYKRNAERVLEPDPETAPLVKEAFELRAAGMSWTDLAKWSALVHPLMPTTRKGIRDLCSNRAYLGEARGVAGLKNPAAHPAIISHALFKKASKREKPLRTGALKNAEALLRGFLRCGGCGQNLYLCYTGAKKELAYNCRNPHCTEHAYIKAEPLEQWFEQDLLERFEASKAELHLPNEAGDLEAAEKALEDADSDLAAWVDNIEGMKIIGAERWNDKAAEFQMVRDMAAQEVEGVMAAQAAPTLPVDLRKWWAEQTLESRRGFLDKFISHLEIRPAKGKRGIPVEDRVSVFGSGQPIVGIETQSEHYKAEMSYQASRLSAGYNLS
jgi:DNA invertase Pin-like site-specific DNA recombinase